MQFNNELISITADISASRNSIALLVEQDLNCSIQVVFSGTGLNGAFKLQASCDTSIANAQSEVVRASNVSNWSDIPSQSSTVTALTGSSTALFNLADMGYPWVRLVWTSTSGTGSIVSARITRKNIV